MKYTKKKQILPEFLHVLIVPCNFSIRIFFFTTVLLGYYLMLNVCIQTFVNQSSDLRILSKLQFTV